MIINILIWRMCNFGHCHRTRSLLKLPHPSPPQLTEDVFLLPSFLVNFEYRSYGISMIKGTLPFTFEIRYMQYQEPR